LFSSINSSTSPVVAGLTQVGSNCPLSLPGTTRSQQQAMMQSQWHRSSSVSTECDWLLSSMISSAMEFNKRQHQPHSNDKRPPRHTVNEKRLLSPIRQIPYTKNESRYPASYHIPQLIKGTRTPSRSRLTSTHNRPTTISLAARGRIGHSLGYAHKLFPHI
jgi:hypothetical protein